jgi:hypothetical protein
LIARGFLINNMFEKVGRTHVREILTPDICGMGFAALRRQPPDVLWNGDMRGRFARKWYDANMLSRYRHV